MAEPIIEIRGDREIIAKYDGIAKDLPDKMKKTMIRSVIYVQGEIPSYPSPPAGSSYRRTGTLGRLLTAFPGHSGPRNIGGGGGDNGGTPLSRVEPLGGGVQGVVGARLKYIPFVVDDKEQAWMHTGRWWTLQKVLRDSRAGLQRLWKADMMGLFK